MIVVALGAAAALCRVAAADGGREHALVVISCDAGQYEIVSAHRAPGPAPKASRGVRGYPLRVIAVSPEGEVLYETGLRDPAVIRGEFAREGGNGEIEGHRFTRKRYTFAVRVPIFKDARLDLFVLDPKLRSTASPPVAGFRRAASFSQAVLKKVLP